LFFGGSNPPSPHGGKGRVGGRGEEKKTLHFFAPPPPTVKKLDTWATRGEIAGACPSLTKLCVCCLP